MISSIGLKPDQTLSLLEVGPVMIGQGHEQEEVLDALVPSATLEFVYTLVVIVAGKASKRLTLLTIRWRIAAQRRTGLHSSA